MKRETQIQILSSEEIQRLAENIYIWGYPLVLMDLTRRTRTATPHPTLDTAPLNQFAHRRFVAGSQDKYLVHPDADCLRSSAWLDLNREPVVLTVPRFPRYHLLSFFSGWYEIFESSSPRNLLSQGGHVGFVAPRSHDKLPAGIKRIVSPTETVWIDARFEVTGNEDVEAVHKVQDQCRLTPLSVWEKPPQPHSIPFSTDIDASTSPQEQLAKLDARAFFTRLSRLLQTNPPQECDIGVVAQFARIGFFPGEDFSFEMLPPSTTLALHAAVAPAQSRIAAAEKTIGRGEIVNNWLKHAHPGRFFRDYLDRAAAARAALAGALAEDVLCFHTTVDEEGKPLRGTHNYAIHFGRDLVPPVNAFWSITLYNPQDHLVRNSIRRNVIGARDRLRLNSDGSLSVYIQHDWPGATRDSNWLPAPKDAFNLTLKMYWPKPEARAGSWRPPAVLRYELR
jgi:hypothetical protein